MEIIKTARLQPRHAHIESMIYRYLRGNRIGEGQNCIKYYVEVRIDFIECDGILIDSVCIQRRWLYCTRVIYVLAMSVCDTCGGVCDFRIICMQNDSVPR